MERYSRLRRTRLIMSLDQKITRCRDCGLWIFAFDLTERCAYCATLDAPNERRSSDAETNQRKDDRMSLERLGAKGIR